MGDRGVGDVLEALEAVARGEDEKIPLEDIRKVSDEHKPGGEDYDQIAAELEALAEDGPAARQLVTRYLHKTKLGYKETREEPIMASGVLAWMVERVANLLDAEPSYRFQTPAGDFEADGSPAALASLDALDALDMTSALRKLHRYSVIAGQAYLRIYRTEEEGLQARVFGAAGVARIPHPALADRVQHDQVLVLPLSGSLFEVHWQTRDGDRYMAWCDDEGHIDALSPHTETNHRTGLDTIPVVRLASEPTVGAPYVAPRASRVTYVLAISGLQNDLHAMCALQAHSLLVWLQADAESGLRDDANTQIPQPGPGAGYKLPKGDELRFETPQPLITSVISVVTSLLKTFLLGEHIPQYEAEGEGERTGQALLVAERGLTARSEAMRPGLIRAAREAWAICQASGETLPASDLVLQLAPQRIPATTRETLEDLAKALALDVTSRVKGIMELRGCSREAAIAELDQIDQDLADYGKGAAATLANRSGGGFTQNLEDADSVADAVRGVTAADARETRRENESEAA